MTVIINSDSSDDCWKHKICFVAMSHSLLDAGRLDDSNEAPHASVMHQGKFQHDPSDNEDIGSDSTISSPIAVFIIAIAFCIILPALCCFSRTLRRRCLPECLKPPRTTPENNSGHREVPDTSASAMREERRSLKKRRIAERRKWIRKNFRNCRLVLTSNDFCGENDKDVEAGFAADDAQKCSENDDSQKFVGYMTLSLPSKESKSGSNEAATDKSPLQRTFPDCCSICLSQYKPGDELVWSSNPICPHAFHKDCIEKWLMKVRYEAICPCCRNSFILEKKDKVEPEFR